MVLSVIIAISILAGTGAVKSLAFIPAVLLLTHTIILGVHRQFSSPLPSLETPVLKGFWIIGLGIISLCGLSTLWAIDPAFAVERTIKIALVILPTLCLAGWINRANNVALSQHGILIIMGFYVAALLIVVIDLYGELPIYAAFSPDKTGNDLHPSVWNRASIFLTFLSLPAFLMTRHIIQPQIRIGLTGCVIILTVLMLLGTESFSIQIAALTGLVLLVAGPYLMVRKPLFFGFKMVLTAIIFALPFLTPWMFETFSNPPVTDNVSINARMEIWDFVGRYALDNPFIGNGIEATRFITDFDTAQRFHEDEGVLHPHNFILQLWIEFGLLGISLFAAALCWILSIIRQHNPFQARLWFTLFGMVFVVANFAFGAWQGSWLGTIMLSILALSASFKIGPASPDFHKSNGA